MVIPVRQGPGTTFSYYYTGISYHTGVVSEQINRAQEMHGNRMHLITLHFQTHWKKLLQPYYNQTSPHMISYFFLFMIPCLLFFPAMLIAPFPQSTRLRLWRGYYETSRYLNIFLTTVGDTISRVYREGEKRIDRGHLETTKLHEDAMVGGALKNQNTANSVISKKFPFNMSTLEANRMFT